MFVDRWRGTIFVEMSTGERTLVVKALREYAANLSGFLGKARTPEYAKRLEARVEEYKSLADCLEGGESNELD